MKAQLRRVLRDFTLLSVYCFTPVSSFATKGDYTGDGIADLAVASITQGTTQFSVYSLGSSTTTTTSLTAAATEYVPADYDGDGITDPAIVTINSTGALEWRVINGSTESLSLFGVTGDKALAGDFDCDGKADKAVIRYGGGRYTWYIQYATGAHSPGIVFGRTGDTFFTSRLRNTSCDDLVLTRTRESVRYWYHRRPNSSFTEVIWGALNDRAIPPSDIDGDGLDDLIAINDDDATSIASIRLSSGGTQTTELGSGSDVPFVGRFAAATGPAQLGYYRRTSGSASTFTLSLPSATSTVTFGAFNDTLLRPDGSFVLAGEGVADTTVGPNAKCGNTVSISSFSGVLYKPSNLHGGRGPTFLVQDVAERTLKRRLLIKDSNCRVISKFGLYRTDSPYGSRYYQRSGGSGHTSTKLYRLAMRTGSSIILVEGKNKLIKVDNPLNRQGNVR